MIKLLTILQEIQVIGGTMLIAKPSTTGTEGKSYDIYNSQNLKLFRILKFKKFSQTGWFHNPNSLNLKRIKDYLDSRRIKYELVSGSNTHINIPNGYIKFLD